MDHDVTWYEGRPRPRPYCVTWGPSFPPKGHSPRPQIFDPCLLWPNGRPSQPLIITLLRVRRLAAFRRMLRSPRTKADQRADYRLISALHLCLSACGRSLNNIGPRWRAAALSRCVRISNYAIGLCNDRLQRSTQQSNDDKGLSFYIALQHAAQNVNIRLHNGAVCSQIQTKPNGDFWRLFCVPYLQRAASSTFQTCILNSH